MKNEEARDNKSIVQSFFVSWPHASRLGDWGGGFWGIATHVTAFAFSYDFSNKCINNNPTKTVARQRQALVLDFVTSDDETHSRAKQNASMLYDLFLKLLCGNNRLATIGFVNDPRMMLSE